MTFKKFLPFMMVACLGVISAHSESTPTIRILVNQSAGTTTNMIFAHNICASDNRGTTLPVDSKKRSDIVNTAEGYWDKATNAPNPIVLDAVRKLKCGMIRYPGGCLSHNYDFRQSIGSLQDRPDWKFGLDEFINYCKLVGAEPLITLTDYLLAPEELPKHHAELVEYLNAPAKSEYPQAMKRASNGHPEPYGVKYFEIGNESYHANHKLRPTRQYTPESYVKFALDSMEAVRKVDPTVKLGVVAEKLDLNSNPSPWDEAVYRDLAPKADFIIHHLYDPKLTGFDPEETRAVIGVAGEVYRQRFTNVRQHLRKLAGKELPIAISEFNIGCSTNKPYPWRFSYAAGMGICQALMEMRRPEQNILMSGYWQHVGGWFGCLRLDNQAGVKYNAVWPFILAFSEYSSNDLLETKLENLPTLTFKSTKAGNVNVAGDKFIPACELGTPPNIKLKWGILTQAGIRGEGNLNHLTFHFKNASKTCFPIFIEIPAPPELNGDSFSIGAKFEARYLPDPASTGTVALGFGLMDGRSYSTTHLATSITGLEKANDWTSFSCSPLSGGMNTPVVAALLRLEKIEGEFSGTLEIRNLKFSCSGGACVPAATALAVESSRAGNTVYLIAINRSKDTMPDVRIELDNSPGKIISGTAKELYQSDISTTELFPTIEKTVPTSNGNTFDWTFPPFSATFFKLQISGNHN